MKKEEIILTDEQKQQLDEMAEQYIEAQAEFESAESKKNSINLIIKQMLSSFGVTKYVSESGITLGITTKHNIKWDEDRLIAYCRGCGVDGIIKTKEYVDMDALESAIYRNEILPESLKPMQIVKPDIVTLRCSKKKQLNE